MLIKSIEFVAAVLIGLTMAVATVAADQSGPMTKELWINGYGYEAQLQPSQINGVANSGDDAHYKGHFQEDPDSWIRVSRLEGGWEGLAFVFNRLHTISSGGVGDRMASYSFSHEETPQCGMDHMHADASITPESLTSPAMVQAVTANYDILCADRVDGACLMLELELAFDLEFQRDFPDDFESRAGAILNNVEGFYQAQFGIIFDTLSLTYMDTDLFSTTTDASDLLTDIRAKRSGGQIPFLESSRSIFHFISGRSLQDEIAGIAFSGSVCRSDGVATGLSRAFGNDTLTSIVVAHEIGHNLGADHDVPAENNCPSGQNIMSPSVRGSFSSFSSCSVDSITSKISSLNSVEQCFNFPADASIAAQTGNRSEVVEGETFQARFDVAYQDAFQPADSLLVEGSIGANEGRLEEVTLDGAACTLSSSGTGFSCDQSQAGNGLLLAQATAGDSPTLTLTQGVALVSSSGEVKDIKADNDLLATTFTVAQADNEPSGDTDGSNMPPGDSGSGSESGSSSGGSSGGGGGGSLGWFWLLAGLAGVGRMAKRAV